MDDKNIQPDELIIKFLQGIISKEEHHKLDEWLVSSEENQQIFENFMDNKWVSAEIAKLYQYNEEKGWKRVQEGLILTPARKESDLEVTKIRRMFPLRQAAVAASII